MKIVVDGRPYAGGFNGYTTYLSSIIEPLLAAGWQVTLISNRPFNEAHAAITGRCQTKVFGARRASLWEQWSVPRYLRRVRPQVYFVGTNKGLPFWKPRPTQYILALLDIIPYKFPRQYLLSPGYILKELRPVAQLISVCRADALVTISEASARDIQMVFHRQAKALLMRVKITGTPEDLPAEPTETFTYVGGVDNRKRTGELIQAFARFVQDHPTYRLVMIGRGYTEAHGALMDELGVRDKIDLPGFVDQATKMKLIAQSTALVYPSLYEGYGLAIAEGFVAGVPVIAAPGGSQSEVGGKGVYYADPLNPQAIAEAMAAVLDPAVRQQLAEGRKIQYDKLFGPAIDQNIQDFFAEYGRRGQKGNA
ncbi:MAG TPA: glycosyltransferase [Candidatus Saccharimonadia bacterium]